MRILWNRWDVMSYSFCKSCGLKLKFSKEGVQFDRYTKEIQKHRITYECPDYRENRPNHDHWSWVERLKH